MLSICVEMCRGAANEEIVTDANLPWSADYFRRWCFLGISIEANDERVSGVVNLLFEDSFSVRGACGAEFDGVG